MKKLLLWLVLCLFALALLSAAARGPLRPCRTLIAKNQVAAAGALSQVDANGNELYYESSYDDLFIDEEPCYDDIYYTQPYDYTVDIYPDYYESFVPSFVPYTGNTVQTYTQTYTPSYQTTQATQVPTQYVTYSTAPVGVPSGGLMQTPQPIQVAQPSQPILPPVRYIYQQPVSQDPTCSISASPSVIDPWQSVALAWGSENATAAYLSDVGNVSVSGGTYVTSGVSRTYTLTVQGASGRSVACSTNITVRYAPVITYQAPSCFISVSPNQIRTGDIASISWGSTDATSAYLSGVGQVGTVGYYQMTPSQSQTYSLSVIGPGGASSCSSGVVVTQPPVAPTVPPAPQTPLAPTCNISADTASIFTGGTAKLTWSSARSTGVTLSSIGAVASAGTRAVSPTSTQKYILTTTGAGGTRTCSVTVKVTSADSCTVVCNGVTYSCAPVGTPVAAVCPSSDASASGASAQGKSFWDRLKGIFGF